MPASPTALTRWLDSAHRNLLVEIMPFHRLSAAHRGPIVDIQLARLGRLLEDRKIRIELTDAARA